jgi:hypothetical protein
MVIIIDFGQRQEQQVRPERDRHGGRCRYAQAARAVKANSHLLQQQRENKGLFSAVAAAAGE